MNILFLSGHLVKLYYNYCCSRFYYEKYILDLWTHWAFLPRQWNHPRSLVMLQGQSSLLLMLTGQTISVCIEVNKMPLRSKSCALLFWYVKIFKLQKWLLTNLSEECTPSEGRFILVCLAESPVNCETLAIESGFSMWVMLPSMVYLKYKMVLWLPSGRDHLLPTHSNSCRVLLSLEKSWEGIQKSNLFLFWH